MGMFSIWGSPFPYGDYRTEMGRETRIFPYGESPFPNRVCFHLGINIYIDKIDPNFYQKNYPEVPCWVRQRRILGILLVTGLVTPF